MSFSRTLNTAERPSADHSPHASTEVVGIRGYASVIWRYSLTGAGANLLLGIIERLDLLPRTTPKLDTIYQSFTLTSYYSLVIVAGLLIGFAVGVAVLAGSAVTAFIRTLLQRIGFRFYLSGLLSFAVACGVFAIVLDLYPPVVLYVKTQIREAEKVHFLNQPLLNHERITSLVIVFGLLACCWMLWKLTQCSAKFASWIRFVWLAALTALLLASYYVNSRVEVALYQHSLHRSLFMLDTALAMAIVGTLYLSSDSIRGVVRSLGTGKGKGAGIAVAIILVACSAFTFQHLNKDQTLKVIVFYRTITAKSNFQFLQWILDRDRDGYSAILGGCDCDDSNGGINPGSKEVVGNGVDEDCIAGDLTANQIAEWNRQLKSARPAPEAGAKKLNVIYIFIDALRADHLGVYGYKTRNTSPNIDRLAAESSFFENGYTAAPNTFEALPKFMKSCYWDAHVPTWTEVLAKNGYDTMLFPQRTATLLRHVKGMKEVYHPEKRYKGDLEANVNNAISKLSAHPADTPFCAYIYAPDPHRPYKYHAQFHYGSSITDMYDGDIAYTDYHFGRLFDWLRSSGHMKDTMIVFMADHGESLGERMIYKHSTQLYNEQAHIPFIVYVPGIAPRKIPDYVTSVDLGATILSAVGITSPDDYAGANLLPLMEGQPFVHPPIYAEQTTREDSPYVTPSQQLVPVGNKYMVITQDGFKLIYDRDFYCFELYDLKHDPGEVHNLLDKMPGRAEQMKRMVGIYEGVVKLSRPDDADEQQYIFRHGSQPEGAEENEAVNRLLSEGRNLVATLIRHSL